MQHYSNISDRVPSPFKTLLHHSSFQQVYPSLETVTMAAARKVYVSELSIRQYLEPLMVYRGMHGMYTFAINAVCTLYVHQGYSRHKPNLSVVHGFGLRNYDIHALSALCALHDLVHRVALGTSSKLLYCTWLTLVSLS